MDSPVGTAAGTRTFLDKAVGGDGLYSVVPPSLVTLEGGLGRSG